MSYIDGFLAAVPTGGKEAYRIYAETAARVFAKHGALRMVECWGDDVPDGKLTSFPLAVKKSDDETVVFSWIEWPSKAARDDGWKQIMQDPLMQPGAAPMPFDGKRMIYGGFTPFVGAPAPAKPAIQPYLFFRGRCEEAIAYYQAALGAEVLVMMRFKDNPDKPSPDKMPPGMDERIMHASVRIAGSDIMMSDGMRSGPTDFECMALSLSLESEAEVDRLFQALAAEGKIQMPLGPTFFARRFGAVVDKLGVTWMLIAE